MLKTYKAIGTQVSLVLFINGENYRVNFRPVSNYVAGMGGSELTTDSEELQNALESQYEFGRVYYIVGSNGELVTSIEEQVEDIKEEESAAKEPEYDIVKVPSISDAKLWLIDNKGWEPKGRVTKKIIQDVALSYGVKFDIDE